MGQVLVAHGARAAEALLLERLDALLEEIRRDPALLATPIRVVVPSSSLRDHLLERLVAPRAGRAPAVTGLAVQTLFTLAAEIVERAGETAPLGENLFEILAQREARGEAALREVLEGLSDGFATVVGSVRDLIDAGIEPVHAEAAEEALRTDGARHFGPGPIERAVALVRTAARTEERMAQLGRGRRSSLLRRATELLTTPSERRVAGEVLPTHALFIHGFADATGVASDLLEAMIRWRGAIAILDRPPRAAGSGSESAFVDRFVARLLLAAPCEEAEPPAPIAPATLRACMAAGVDAEVREAGRQILRLLDAGARPEGIGVVARDLTPYRFALSRHFGRLGLPFHAPGTRGALAPSGRRIGALLELLELAEMTPTDRWLDARRPTAPEAGGGAIDLDLRLALLSLGAARLRDVAALPLESLQQSAPLPLPLRQGLHSGEVGAEDEPEAMHPLRRAVPRQAVRQLVQRAAQLRRFLADWPRRATFEAHARSLRTLLAAGLGWRPEDASRGDDGPPSAERWVEEALARASAEIPPHFELERGELLTLLRRLLRDAGASALGGRGGGIQVLTVTEARARTFDHLFVLGLHRNSFPRVVRQDPLLPDDLRAVLQRVLPDVPLKLAGYDEERYLFAQLLSAAPEVALSWQSADDDGQPLPPSPLIDRLRGALEVERAPAPWSAVAAEGFQTAGERATYAGLATTGGRQAFARLLPLALAEARGLPLRQPPPLSLHELAAGRVAILSELDPDLRTEEGRAARAQLGPYFGFVGALDPGVRRTDPRFRPLYVTHLERLAGCPWQLLLERLLGIEAAPDPTGILPGIDPSLLGRTVHAVLEAIGRRALPSPSEEGATRSTGGPKEAEALELALPVQVEWPSAEALAELARQAAAEQLEDEGIYLAGLAGALARQALPYLEVARRVDWGEGALSLLSIEADGEIAVPATGGRTYPLRFRADRVDLKDGVRRWTDYKTGRPLSESRKEATRNRHFLARVRAGTQLQAVAYLLGAQGENGSAALGRYLFLDPAIDDDGSRELALRPSDRPFRDAFDRAVAALLESWEAGTLFPRLVELNGREEPPRCARCAVAEACLRGDSGARRRLHDWTVRADATTASGAAAALLRTWRLAAPPEGDGVPTGARAVEDEPAAGGTP